MITSRPKRVYESGRAVGMGSFCCEHCGLRIAVDGVETLPRCERCGSSGFRRASLFSQTVDSPAIHPEAPSEAWLKQARERIHAEPALAISDHGGNSKLHLIRPGWTRIGRSVRAGIRLDDPTISRRHALLIRTPEEGLRILDDRSLNGIFVNGERVEWAALADGDELTLGCFSVLVIGTGVPAPATAV